MCVYFTELIKYTSVYKMHIWTWLNTVAVVVVTVAVSKKITEHLLWTPADFLLLQTDSNTNIIECTNMNRLNNKTFITQINFVLIQYFHWKLLMVEFSIFNLNTQFIAVITVLSCKHNIDIVSTYKVAVVNLLANHCFYTNWAYTRNITIHLWMWDHYSFCF